MKKINLALATLFLTTAGSLFALDTPAWAQNGNGQGKGRQGQGQGQGQKIGQRGKRTGPQDGSGPIHSPGTGGGSGAGQRRGRR